MTDIRLDATLYEAVLAARTADPSTSRTARLLRSGRAKMAKKLAEEAVEVVIDAMHGDREAVVRESADLLYNLVVLWVVGRRPSQGRLGGDEAGASGCSASPRSCRSDRVRRRAATQGRGAGSQPRPQARCKRTQSRAGRREPRPLVRLLSGSAWTLAGAPLSKPRRWTFAPAAAKQARHASPPL